MTRKRFIKLCMSKGYSRNRAEKLAADVIADGMSYDQGYACVLRMANIDWVKLGEAVSKTIDAVAEATRKLATAAGQVIEVIGRSIQEAFSS